MCRIRLGAAVLLASALLPSTLRAAEPYEGAWVRTSRECKVSDGATSLTVIDHKVSIDGKPMAMVEQYENHCFIDKKSSVGNDTILNVTCYEFWDDFRKKVNSRKASVKLSLLSKDTLRIDGKDYVRCPERGTKPARKS